MIFVTLREDLIFPYQTQLNLAMIVHIKLKFLIPREKVFFGQAENYKITSIQCTTLNGAEIVLSEISRIIAYYIYTPNT